MSMLSQFGVPRRAYYDWLFENCGAYRAELTADPLTLTITGPVGKVRNDAFHAAVRPAAGLLPGPHLRRPPLAAPPGPGHRGADPPLWKRACAKSFPKVRPGAAGRGRAGGAGAGRLPALPGWSSGCAGSSTVWLAFAAETLICYQLLAAKSLRDESMKVYRALKDGTLGGAPRRLHDCGPGHRRPGRAGVAKAAVETVAENASDGVIAPLIFLALGGAPLGMFYKAVNTMDSMVGYQNDRYLYFGRAAARWDDALNFHPRPAGGGAHVLGGGLPG